VATNKDKGKDRDPGGSSGYSRCSRTFVKLPYLDRGDSPESADKIYASSRVARKAAPCDPPSSGLLHYAYLYHLRPIHGFRNSVAAEQNFFKARDKRSISSRGKSHL
jgi:hypothetical protein